MRKYCLLSITILLLLGMSGISNATMFAIGSGGSLTFAGLDSGDYSATALATSSFNLTEGHTSETLSFFDVSLNSFTAGSGAVQGSIQMTAPVVASLDDSGTYWGANIGWGWFSMTLGNISWGDPLEFEYGDGGLFALDLFDLSGVSLGNAFTIRGTITNLRDVGTGGSAPAPVPEPASMLLLGTGMVGLAGASRKKIFKKS